MAVEEAGIATHSSPGPPRLLGNVEETQGESRPWRLIGKGWEHQKFIPISLISAGINTLSGGRPPVRNSLTSPSIKLPGGASPSSSLRDSVEQSRGSPASREIPGIPTCTGTGPSSNPDRTQVWSRTWHPGLSLSLSLSAPGGREGPVPGACPQSVPWHRPLPSPPPPLPGS